MVEEAGRTPDDLRAFAQRCRMLAAGVGSPQDRQHLLDLAVTLEAEAQAGEQTLGGPMPVAEAVSANSRD